jgi:AcrR family transcriptional regulator
LLDAALSLFVEKGFAATRAEEIAARVGVSKATIYVYFPSKQDLLKALIARELSAVAPSGARLQAVGGECCADLLRRQLATWWSLLADTALGGIFKLVITEVRVFPELMDFWLRAVVEPCQKSIGKTVREAVESGEFRPADPDVVVRSLVLPMIMGCLHRHTIGACSAADRLLGEPDFFSSHVDFVLQGLAPCTGASASSSARA